MEYTEVQELVYKMLTENTGTALGDSGGAYGRNWERNQKKTIEDFDKELEVKVSLDKDGYLYRDVSVFHYLSGLELDDTCREFNKINTEPEDWNSELYGVSKKGYNYLVKVFGEDAINQAIENYINTYNYDSDLSQTLQYTIIEDEWILMQIHGGCDVRGGYTDAKLFKLSGFQESIHEYIRDSEDQDYIIEEIKENNIDVYDYMTDKTLSVHEINLRLNKNA
jgi:translation initiation factor 2 beta subunit (eIF-2beta)/eIF-5